MSELPTTIAAAGRALRDGSVTSAALTEELLRRIHATQDTIGAFITVTDEAAISAARKADAELAAGLDRGPLHGIPMGIKDIIATEDAPTTANSRVMDPSWGKRGDATVVKRLRAAGIVSLGKLGLNEYAIGWPDPDTGFRIPRNPWDLRRTPGGSSSGTGAALAGGLILGGLGTDTGGSIRGPAAFCGVSGIKQTFGLVSKEGCVPLGYSLDHIGPMARTVEDCALMLQVMAGYDPLDACSVDVPVPNMTAGLGGALAGVTIGVPRQYFFEISELDTEVKASVLAAVDTLAGLGATVVDVDIPHAAEARLAQRVTMTTEAYTYHEPDLQTRPELYGKYTRRTIQLGAYYTGADYVQAQRVRSLVKAECAALFTGTAGTPRVDAVVTPTMLTVAPIMEGYDPDSMFVSPGFTPIWNLTGLPSLSIPSGFSTAGMPIGMQIVGPAYGEPMVFKVGDAYQRVTDWHVRQAPAFGGGVTA